ncbi:unnamed protein product [Pleuronectes platessa]|uniref:Uncharacterized protein n=1 Tax=Pleuronectes platessa TaxID=8262 RepID=A0A9N7YE27_PLEPL|nr:unnamed protein product [Pleuronectes platessa]
MGLQLVGQETGLMLRVWETSVLWSEAESKPPPLSSHPHHPPSPPAVHTTPEVSGTDTGTFGDIVVPVSLKHNASSSLLLLPPPPPSSSPLLFSDGRPPLSDSSRSSSGILAPLPPSPPPPPSSLVLLFLSLVGDDGGHWFSSSLLIEMYDGGSESLKSVELQRTGPQSHRGCSSGGFMVSWLVEEVSWFTELINISGGSTGALPNSNSPLTDEFLGIRRFQLFFRRQDVVQEPHSLSEAHVFCEDVQVVTGGGTFRFQGSPRGSRGPSDVPGAAQKLLVVALGSGGC